jgi:hypothetical protein
MTVKRAQFIGDKLKTISSRERAPRLCVVVLAGRRRPGHQDYSLSGRKYSPTPRNTDLAAL